MIIELILLPFFKLISFVISLIPSVSNVNGVVSQSFYDFMKVGLYFFGSSSFCLVIASVVSWSVIHLGWAIVEWVYKKIPGVS